MKKSNLILLLFIVVVSTWIGTSILNVQNAKNRKGIILSPNMSKSVEFINANGTSQLLMNFHKNLTVSGSNIASGNFDANEIKVIWSDEYNLSIEYPNGVKLRNKEEEIYYFGEIIKINYKEITKE